MRRPPLLGAAAAALVLSSCAHVSQDVPAAPNARWEAPPEARNAPEKKPASEISPEAFAGRTVSLAEAIGLALKNSPLTRQSWLNARAAAADLGSKRMAYLPSLTVDAQLLRQKSTAVGGRFTTLLTTYGPTATLNWLLLDLGGRSGDVDEARQNLFAADYSHDATMNDLALRVTQAYYQYQTAKSLLVSQEASLKQAEENYAAASDRNKAGVATIADVLQARTSLSQQKLAYDTVRGQIETIRGALATALGVPANLPVEAAPLPEDVNVEATTETVDRLIEIAESERPDLAAARAAALAASSHVRSVRAEGLPQLSAIGTLNRTWFEGGDAAVAFGDNYSIGLFFHFPVLNGWKTPYDTKKAQAEAEVAASQAEGLRQQVVLQVWTSYYNLQTAAQRVRTARDLLASAKESEDVARGRYREGVGSILDLLTAESALAGARAQEVQARADFLVSLSQLAHDAGRLGPEPPAATAGSSKDVQ